MAKITDTELVKNVKLNSCNSSLKELIYRHSALCVDICKKYTPALQASGVSVDDVYKDKDYIVYKSALSFNPNKNVKFSTWLGNQVRYYCLNTINKNGTLLSVDTDHLDYLSSQKEDLNEKKYDLEIEYVFTILSKLKDTRIKDVFNYRYFKTNKNKMPWSEIALKMGISTQTAINLHKRGIKILNKKMNSNDPDII
tara:strand:- start:6120 stop:6710 length:591 start_codon:yes stop_codon:yes gene_type:complete